MASPQYCQFQPITTKYIRLVALSTASTAEVKTPTIGAAEINLLDAGMPVSPTQQGEWGVTIDLPLIPVLSALEPKTADVLSWPSMAPDSFTSGPPGQTVTATYTPSTGLVTQETVTNTHHDMFCPGVSFRTDGLIIVTGGNTAAVTSIFWENEWSAGAQMSIPRGYNSQVTLSSSGVFTIGGSWSGALGGKYGEVYAPVQNTWTALPGTNVNAMFTADQAGIYRQDNDAWLFARENSSIFQAGPSKNMNWWFTIFGEPDLTTPGDGTTTPAGSRADDNHAMNGNAVMYDAVAGEIMTTGGAPDYDASQATANAHVITLGEKLEMPRVERIANIKYRRAFHNSVL